MIKENQKHLNRFQVVLDGAVIFVSLLAAWLLRFKSGIIPVADGYLSIYQYLKPALIIIPVYIFIYNVFKLYTPHRNKSASDEFINIFKANAAGLLCFIVLLYIVKEINYSRYLLLLFGFICVLGTLTERMFVRLSLRSMRKKGYNVKHILLVGLGDNTLEFIQKVRSNRQWGYDILGILDDTKEKDSQADGIRVIGSLSKLEDNLNNKGVDDVYITLPLCEYHKLGRVIEICEKAGVRTNIIPDYLKYIPAKPYVEELDGLPVINIRYVPLDDVVNRGVKRSFDILVSLISILVFSPFMIIAAIGTKLSSPGPVIFKQERIGLNRKPFMMYKFRSMRVQKPNEEAVKWTTKDDPRKTAFGSFIRKTSIDELPQIFNVLKGDMSLVGPRPERPHFVEQFREEIPKYMIKHQVRPGITGWAQVNGWRGDTSIKKRIECDLYYIENWSFWFDIRIMWLTVFKGFVNKNAY